MSRHSHPAAESSSSNPQIRRRNLATSEMAVSTNANSRSASLALAMQQALVLEAKLAEEAAEASADIALQRMLSLKSVVSTSSSFAENQQAAVGKIVKFREIGKGSIGRIFEHPGTVLCYKLPLLDNSNKLWNNYVMHTRVQEGFAKASKHVDIEAKIPRMCWFANKDTASFWNENLEHFPFTDAFPKKARDALCMERVLPLPQPIRHHLIDKYCPREKEDAKAHPPNQDCLVRPLLGRKRRGSGTVAFSLRNFRLHLDQFQELKLDVQDYVMAMADAMAVLHCEAKVDAMDIEFVIGSAPADMTASGSPLTSEEIAKMRPGSSTYEMSTGKDFTRRILCLWVLDFDDCKIININSAGAQAAVKAFIGTETYCPRPSTDQEVNRHWRTFGNRYMKTCAALGAPSQFASAFLNGVEKEINAGRAEHTAGTKVADPSTQEYRPSTEASVRGPDRGRGRGRGQEGRRGGGSGENRRPSRDLSGNWRS